MTTRTLRYYEQIGLIASTHPVLEETLDMESETGAETTQLDIFVPIKPRM